VKIESTKSTLTPLYYNDGEVKIESTKSTLTPLYYNDDEVKIESTKSTLTLHIIMMTVIIII
jgi:hypothetical protein